MLRSHLTRLGIVIARLVLLVAPAVGGFGCASTGYRDAIVELAEPASADIAIHPIATGTFSRGLEFTAVGYGGSGHGTRRSGSKNTGSVAARLWFQITRSRAR